MNSEQLSNAINLARLGVFDEIEIVIDAAARVCEIERLDEMQASIHVWNSGLSDKPYMFEIRRAGCLYGQFMDVENRYKTRAEAEAIAVKICESMISGTFQETYTHLRTRCPRCKGPIGDFTRECLDTSCKL